MMGTNECGDCTTCDCGRTFCRSNEVSPGEMEGKCAVCWEKALNAHDSLGFRSPAVAAEWSEIADNDLRVGLAGWGQ